MDTACINLRRIYVVIRTHRLSWDCIKDQIEVVLDGSWAGQARVSPGLLGLRWITVGLLVQPHVFRVKIYRKSPLNKTTSMNVFLQRVALAAFVDRDNQTLVVCNLIHFSH
jgi:hypothetical protein